MSEAGALNPAFGMGDRIRKARRNVGMEQKDLAAAVGVSRPLVSRWERDRGVPDLNQAVAIAEVTHTSLAWIAGLLPVSNRTGRHATSDSDGSVTAGHQPKVAA